jgi:transcriptional regulator with XRE-family HTH domain
MGYRLTRKLVCSAEITRAGKSCQAKFATALKNKPKSPFGTRLREAFKGASNTEIASKLGVKQSAITNYMAGRIPLPDTLLLIADLTQCSLHWLLTGEGEADLDPFRFLDEPIGRIVQKLADDSGRKFEETLREVINDGLVSRVKQLLLLYPNLRGKELEQMRMLYLLFGVEEENANSNSDPETSSRRRTSR